MHIRNVFVLGLLFLSGMASASTPPIRKKPTKTTPAILHRADPSLCEGCRQKLHKSNPAWERFIKKIKPTQVNSFYSQIQMEELPDLSALDPKDTLIIFKVDDVLLQPKDALFKSQESDEIISEMPYRTKHVYKIKKKGNCEIKKYLKRDDLKYFIPREAVDPKMPDFTAQLVNKDFSIVALTSHPIGEKLGFAAIEDLRLKDLAQAGYNFGKSFPNKPKKILGKKLFSKFTAMYKDGVIFHTVLDKRAVLGEFFKTLASPPKRIIYITNAWDRQVPLAELCEELKIEGLGIQYMGVKTQKPRLSLRNQQCGLYQIGHFHEKGKWIPAEQALKNMPNIPLMIESKGHEDEMDPPSLSSRRDHYIEGQCADAGPVDYVE